MFITKLIQVTVVACVYSLPMVSCQDVAKGLEGGVKNILNDTTANTVKRYSMLYNACTHMHLTIIGKKVTALGNENSPYANMSIETVLRKNTIGLTIFGVKSKRYLCFNRKGKLISTRRARSERCVFTEIISPGFYTEFQSIYNHGWLVGFNAKGKPLKEAVVNKEGRNPDSYNFIKRGPSYITTEQEEQGPKMPFDMSNLNVLPKERQKASTKAPSAKGIVKRHRKRNGRRAKKVRHPSR